jgi:hypothetical protein
MLVESERGREGADTVAVLHGSSGLEGAGETAHIGASPDAHL